MNEPQLFNTIRQAVARYNKKYSTAYTVESAGDSLTIVGCGEKAAPAVHTATVTAGKVEMRPSKAEFIGFLATMQDGASFSMPAAQYFMRFAEFTEWAKEAGATYGKTFVTVEENGGLSVYCRPQMEIDPQQQLNLTT